ncbi:hypothetical protein GCM10023063_20390 [Arthrobacter methylotrophus]
MPETEVLQSLALKTGEPRAVQVGGRGMAGRFQDALVGLENAQKAFAAEGLPIGGPDNASASERLRMARRLCPALSITHAAEDLVAHRLTDSPNEAAISAAIE